jgi:4-hydroxy-3-methylbut-2-enyl diphosphate reductase
MPRAVHGRILSADAAGRMLDRVQSMVSRLVVAAPRGFCAGVVRAVDTVERALDEYGAPVYVRKHIVHNAHVVHELEQRGAIFVESETDVPPGATLVLAAHGVPPDVYRNARTRGLFTIDATCPLVRKVHAEARRFADEGFRIVLIGHAGHDEVVGTTGYAPDAIVLVETADDARGIEIGDSERIAYVTQTTLSVEETAEIVAVLRERFPTIVGPGKDDICYATTNRQNAVKAILDEIDILVVIGSRESSNSNRLVETAAARGVPARLVQDETELEELAFEHLETVGITAGASTPERLVLRAVRWFRDRGVTDVRWSDGEDERVFFRLPIEPSYSSPGSTTTTAVPARKS